MTKAESLFVLCMLVLAFSSPVRAGKVQELERQIEMYRSETEMKIRQLEQQIERIKLSSASEKEQASETKITWDKHLSIKAPDNLFSLTLRGRIQPRFEYEKRQNPDLSDHTSFFMRRTRLDLRGHVYDDNLTFRIMPEMSRQINLRDAWIDYRFSPFMRIRFGQYQVPFHWERDSSNSSNRHQFMERSLAGEEFQLADGRDIGLMLHGDRKERLFYAAGVFSGQGRNQRRSGSDGVLVSGRGALVLTGKYPSSEALIEPVAQRNISIGFGGYYAGKNNVRDWYPWGGGAQEAADIAAITADLHYQEKSFSTHLSGFYRSVNPLNYTLENYSGSGFVVQSGILLVPKRLFTAVRYSQTDPNTSEHSGRLRETILSLQFFLRSHDSKIALETGRNKEHDGSVWHNTDLIRMQYQLLF